MKNNYSAENIQVLSGLEPVRKRPGMFIGSTGPSGLHHLVYEVVDNSIDEALAGYAKNILVSIEKENVVFVEDDGRGIPVDVHPDSKVSALEVVMTKLHAGGKFDKQSYAVSGGLHGVGISVVNALSEWCKVSVRRNGSEYEQKYQRGIAEGPVTITKETTATGTTVIFKPDIQIFETIQFSFDMLSNRLRELAFLNKGIKIKIEDKRVTPVKKHFFLFEGGVKEFVTFLNKSKKEIQEEPIYFNGNREEINVEIAIGYNDGYNENVFSFANNINTKEGGSHLVGFRSALTRTLNDYLRKSKHAKKLGDATLTGEDVREGLTAVISVKLREPQFEGQTKAKLGNSEVRGVVEGLVNENLTLYFDKHPKTIEVIIEKTILAAKARIAARREKELIRRKTFLESAGLPGKLADCSNKNPEETEIYIVEGDSAGGSAKQGRNREFQAVLPLWGKMLNVEKTRIDKVLRNDKLQPIITALGAGVSDDFDVSKLRYHKIIIMADADVDGSHIRTLLLTFFFRYMSGIFENGHVYIAMPPLYKISAGKQEKYAYEDKEKDEIISKIGKNAAKTQINVQRYKGLGEMNPLQLWETTMNPETRSIIRVSLDDVVEAEEIFSTLMGEKVTPRRQFIEQNATEVTNLDI